MPTDLPIGAPMKEYLAKYHYNVRQCKEEGLFLATCREYPGILCHGDSRNEALAECKDAVKLCMEYLEEESMEVPKPESED
jgi:predicted RNase H-like HicB family nuclease